MRPKISFLLVLIVFSLVAVIFSGEMVFRVYGYYSGIDFRLYAKELRNSQRLPETLFDNPLRANASVLAATSDFSVIYNINSHGLRDREYDYQKPANTSRIAVFGDSFTFGEGIPYGQRFTDIPEDQIASTEILNFGYPGAGLGDITSYLLREGLKYQPDLVVVMLNNLVTVRGGADISWILDSTPQTDTKSEQVLSATSDTTFLSRNDPFFDYHPNFILRHSYAASFFHFKYLQYKLRHQMISEDKSFWDDFTKCRQSDDCDRITNTDLTRRTSQLLDKISNICDQNDCRLVVINIDPEKLHDFDSQNKTFKYIDLSPDLQELQKQQRLSFTYDQHFNVATNRFLGIKMTDILKNN